jgi:LPXTG-motif cell wall-anchored protein
MNPIRSMVVGVAGVSMLVLVTAGPAFAADDTSYVGPPPPSVTTVAPAHTDPAVVVAAATATSSAPVSGSLPFTGGDVAGLTLAGAGLTAVGAGLVVRSRRRRLA